MLELRRGRTLLIRRLWALLLRHVYVHIGSWPRIVEMLYWPLINMLLWGFTSLYVVRKLTGVNIIGSALVGGTLLNEVFARMCLMMVLLFLEEVWSRNLGHLFASPLTFMDYALGLIGTALLRAVLSVLPAMVAAYYLFGFSIFSFGWALPPFIFLLIFNGCWYGLIIVSMVIRYGLSAEWLAWMSIWLLSPLMAPYYPVAILPKTLQYVSWSLPGTYVFDAMKELIGQNTVNVHDLWMALTLNVIYSCCAAFIYNRAYRSAQKRGGILQVGE
ncbi:MAG: ABC transporter permease [Pseudomonadota bacterium]|nr:ABC transporter permease [Pseudomonadota bacterium]